MKNDMQHAHIWDAQLYHSHSSMQLEAALNLIKGYSFSNCTKVIDLGCGDGKITAMLAQSLPRASIVGIDVSPQMIDFASRKFLKAQNSNLDFQVNDIRNFDACNQYDLVCSFFALQWIKDLNCVFRSIYRSMNNMGVFIFIVPCHISLALDKALQEIIHSTNWIEYFQDFSPGWYFRDPKEIQDLLKRTSFKIDYLQLKLQKMHFTSRIDLKQFVSPWLTHLDRIPEILKSSFLTELFDRYLELEPPCQDGSILYQYSYIESVAKKCGP